MEAYFVDSNHEAQYKKIPTLSDGIDLLGKDALSTYAQHDQMEV